MSLYIRGRRRCSISENFEKLLELILPYFLKATWVAVVGMESDDSTFTFFGANITVLQLFGMLGKNRISYIVKYIKYIKNIKNKH